MNILFLHTLSNNIDLFAPLASQALPHHTLHHDVQAHFLSIIREQGETDDISQEIHAYLKDKLNSGYDYIVCTCSTLGPIVDRYPDHHVFRVDRPMAQACTSYQQVLVAVTLESTIEPTKALLAQFAPNTQIRVLLINDAWDHYIRQDITAFNQCIAETIALELTKAETTFDAIVFAQASMYTALPNVVDTIANSEPCHNIPLLNSPDSCLCFLVSLLECQ